ncbi:MFS transporter [Cellulomonas cellasea]|uniref:MFS transporter n=1 Tax=Cellulomonas cellasea TaxID=43670 RepID=UPI0025A3864B|nr:MFS transporter [Cellulomonas cellasea]MDM8085489.1 MFS transporter [Cellulomonas cellasea]
MTARRTDDPRLRAASAAVFVVFALNGFNFSSWASRLPAVRDALGLSPEQMGALLLVGAIGSLIALPLSGMVVTRLGARRTVLTFALVNAVGLALAAVGVTGGVVLVVASGAVVFGVGTGTWDASMNLEGAAVEQKLGHTVMPRYHAGFSIGTAVGAGLAAVAAGLGVPVGVHIPVAVLASSIGVALAVRRFLPEREVGAADSARQGDTTGADPATAVEAPSRARRAFGSWLEPRTLLIGLVVLAAALTEGSANDWVALAVVDGFGTTDAIGAMAFGVFVTAMTAMRFFGTPLLDRYGRVATLRLCALLSLVGLGIFTLAPTGMLWLALIGIVLWGMGAALGFPVGMSAASDDPAHAAGRVSVVATIGYSAFLAGPPVLGLLAGLVGYRHALLAIAVPVLVGLFVLHAVRPPTAQDATGSSPDAGSDRPASGN